MSVKFIAVTGIEHMSSFSQAPALNRDPLSFCETLFCLKCCIQNSKWLNLNIRPYAFQICYIFANFKKNSLLTLCLQRPLNSPGLDVRPQFQKLLPAKISSLCKQINIYVS